MTKAAQLKAKIGQMIMVGFAGAELKPRDTIVKAILAKEIGGVILFDYNFKTKTYEHNIQNPQQLKHLTAQLQFYAQHAMTLDILQNKEDDLPLLIGIDYEGGNVNRLKDNYGFPKTLSAAEIGKLSLPEAYHYANLMAKTLKESGININFAPVLDLNTNPNNPIIGKLKRSFSDQPQKVIDYAKVFSRAYSEQDILCVYKHFPGHGSSMHDTHQGFVDVTQTWQKAELQPFQQLLCEAYSHAVMTAHVIHYGLDQLGLPASISHAMTQKLLRDQLRFQGVVFTDDLQMKAITEHYGIAKAVNLAINAGADILVFGNQLLMTPQDPQEIIEIIYKDVLSNKIPQQRIHESYQRIMALKQKLRINLACACKFL